MKADENLARQEDEVERIQLRQWEAKASNTAKVEMVKAVVDEISDIRLEVVKEIKVRIKTNDYPIENNLDEMIKKMIQSNIMNPL